jgi:hypothetical protein
VTLFIKVVRTASFAELLARHRLFQYLHEVLQLHHLLDRRLLRLRGGNRGGIGHFIGENTAFYVVSANSLEPK